LSICLLHSGHWPYTLAVGNAPMKSMGRATALGHQESVAAGGFPTGQHDRFAPKTPAIERV
jgi:hypothetical protein